MTVRIFNGTVISSSVAVLLSWAATVLIIVYKLKLSGSQVWNLILYSLLIVVPLLVLMILISFVIASRVTKGIINKIEKMGDDVEQQQAHQQESETVTETQDVEETPTDETEQEQEEITNEDVGDVEDILGGGNNDNEQQEINENTQE